MITNFSVLMIFFNLSNTPPLYLKKEKVYEEGVRPLNPSFNPVPKGEGLCGEYEGPRSAGTQRRTKKESVGLTH